MYNYYEKGEIVGEMRKFITADDIETVIVGAVEGGINYWGGIVKDENFNDKPKDVPLSIWVTKLLLEGKGVTIRDIEGDEEDVVLTIAKLIDGISKNAEERYWDMDISNGDATTYDCIIQYAIYGDIVFG